MRSETGYQIEKLLFRQRLDPAASNTATLRPVSVKSLSAAFWCRDHHASYRNNHGVRTFAEQFAFAEGKGGREISGSALGRGRPGAEPRG